jgi:hypothetical protein
MDWKNEEWGKLDQLYYPKRKVENTLSRYVPFNIGSIRSQKMNKTVEYESLTECLFYYFLELDPKTIKYYVQPVEVPILVTDHGELKAYHHVPDVLVYRQGHDPTLYQIKAKELTVHDQNYVRFDRHNKACKAYARDREWNYVVIYPRSTDKIVTENIKNIIRYTKKRKHYAELIPQILYKLRFMENCTMDRLANSFESICERRYIIPHIYYLIAANQIWVDLFKPINIKSELKVGSTYHQLEESMTTEERDQL